MWPIFNLGLFAGVPEMAIFDFYFGIATTMLMVLIPIVLVIMVVQRS